ncbi:MAG: hypothetical protein KDK70_27830 [Myxococcales bacterium]|nr:hypothetical protein [Myxococcales bacterium]
MRRIASAHGAALWLLALAACSDDLPPAETEVGSSTGDPDSTTSSPTSAETSTTQSVDSTGDPSCQPSPEDVQPLAATVPWPQPAGSVDRLREYVQADDPAYTYALDSDLVGIGYTAYFIQMDSLQWRPDEEISPSVWSHWLTIIVPDMPTTTKAHLVIVGGDVSDELPSMSELPLVAQIVAETGTPAAVLGQIPAQPSTAPDRPEPMSEDDLVAYSWRKAMDTQDPTWAAYYPMTKAAVRAMDTTQDFLDQTLGLNPDGFIVTGFSKRGATAWLTAAADDRVEAVVPGVFTALELGTLAEQQFASYGHYAEAAQDYVDERVLQEVRSPEGFFLRGAVDLISYVDALTMPHYLLQASGDEFFLADATRAFLDQIPGESPQRIVPNESHGLGHNLQTNLSGLTAWYQAILAEQPRPGFTEEVTDGVLTIQTDQEPSSVTLWMASNPDVPDFRYDTIADAWQPTVLDPTDPQTYEVQLSTPDQGYDAHLVELRFPGVDGMNEQIYSSHVYITPENRPFELDQPLGEPTSLPQWRCDVGAGVGEGDPLYDTLADALPMVVRGELIADVPALVDALTADGTEEEQARAQCAAARLNVELGALDWYVRATADTFVWEHIASAEQESAAQALLRCQALNNL